jgi:aminoglycoside phosphotransferase (APT) family kinase protein
VNAASPLVLADPVKRGPVLASVVAQLRVLQALDGAGFDTYDPLAITRDRHQIQRLRPAFPAWAAGLDVVLDELAAVLAGDPRKVVSHNDLNPGNILWDGQRAWLVDWEVAGLTHPFYDLAALAMFLRLDDATAHALLAQLDERARDEAARVTFSSLRRLAALLAGLTLLGKVPDLAILPAAAPTLGECYGRMRTGQLDLQDPRGYGAFALALLRAGTSGDA